MSPSSVILEFRFVETFPKEKTLENVVKMRASLLSTVDVSIGRL